MLNVWKYDHLCENLTFIRYLCEICSMCENMTICVKIWHSLNICVKYAQCVTIWPFDVLVLFLMPCVQFLKPCVQFLMNTILNQVIVQFLIKKKRKRAVMRCVSHLRKRETRPWNMHLVSQEKGDACYGGESPFYLIALKRMLMNYSPRRASCTSTWNGRLNTCTHVFKWSFYRLNHEVWRGAQVVLDIQSIRTTMGLKSGEHGL
jgi:hypothetical protein